MTTLPKTILTIGNVSVDIKAFSYEDDSTESYRDGTVELVPGGVARGMAINLQKLGVPCAIRSVVGKDIFGQFLTKGLKDNGIDTSLLKTSEKFKTALFSVMATQGKPASCVYSTRILSEIDFGPEETAFLEKHPEAGLVLDSNISPEVFEKIYNYKKEKDIFVFQNATAPDLAARTVKYAYLIDLFACNEFEAAAILGHEVLPDMECAKEFAELGFRHFIITFGSQGVIVYKDGELWNEKPYTTPVIVDTIGAGDAFASGYLFGLFSGHEVKRCIQYGLACAKETLKTRQTVSDILSPSLIINYPDHKK